MSLWYHDTNTVWTVYFLIDPRDGEIRYVGCTSNLRTRYNAHMAKAQFRRRARTPKAKWIKELFSLGLRPRMIPFLRTKKHGLHRTMEEVWIRRIGLAGCDLLNGTAREKLLATGVIRPWCPNWKQPTEVIYLRIPKRTAVRLRELAKQDKRSIGSTAEIILESYFGKAGA